MLPTVLFILIIYAIYAFTAFWCWRLRRRHPSQRFQGRPRWLTLAGGAGILVLTLGFIFWLAPPAKEQKVKLAGILGLTEWEAWVASQTPNRELHLPVKQPQPGDQPAYALLHPESPPTLAPPAKLPAGTPRPKPKAKATAGVEVKKPRGELKLSTKDKAPSKAKPKKKKTSWTPGQPAKGATASA